MADIIFNAFAVHVTLRRRFGRVLFGVVGPFYQREEAERWASFAMKVAAEKEVGEWADHTVYLVSTYVEELKLETGTYAWYDANPRHIEGTAEFFLDALVGKLVHITSSKKH